MSEFTFELKPAKKDAIPALIGLWGKSGSGKTYSAILLARGLVGPKGKIAVIDTENGRSKFYSELAGGWMHLDLQPPFSPEKYSAAFKFCEQQGANVIVVDSMSHVWEGEGGVLDAAESAKSSSGKALQGLAKFKAPKIAHKRMSNNLIRGAIPVIFCLRAKDAVKQVGNGNDMQIVPLGWQPIAEKNFVFEMTVDLHMTKDGTYDLATSKTIPEALRNYIKPDGKVNEAMGAAIAAWCGSGVALDPEAITLRRDGKAAAMKGMEDFTAWGKALKPEQKAKVQACLSDWTKEAKAADAEAETYKGFTKQGDIPNPHEEEVAI